MSNDSKTLRVDLSALVNTPQRVEYCCLFDSIRLLMVRVWIMFNKKACTCESTMALPVKIRTKLKFLFENPSDLSNALKVYAIHSSIILMTSSLYPGMQTVGPLALEKSVC